ncbi:hypothetical protein [Nitrosomonas sp.]|uniref:hypothetical protein n=1 Tax=Nitrosomonas sp. TaxID=42353 RepID=UPI0025DD4CC6|nr:hypothetical protein [Nitrosomonas sp.]MBY0484205.1 hypothetical protein [Nitrosomonas sp.]
MEPPFKVIDFLPSTSAKWAAWLFSFLSGSLHVLLEWLQIDKLLPLEWAQKLSLSLLPAVLLLIGAIIVLFFVVYTYKKQIEEIQKKPKISLTNWKRG